MPDSNVTATAIWTATGYTLTYNYDGGTGCTTSGTHNGTYSYGTNITLECAPTKTGYVFKEWSITPTSLGTPKAPGATFSMPAQNVTATAIWTANPTVTYYNSTSNPLNVKSGSAVGTYSVVSGGSHIVLSNTAVTLPFTNPTDTTGGGY